MLDAQDQGLYQSNKVGVVEKLPPLLQPDVILPPDSPSCVAVYPGIVKPGDSYLVAFSAPPDTWIGLYTEGTRSEPIFAEGIPQGGPIEVYPLEGRRSGNLDLIAPTVPWTYELRMFPNDQFGPVLASATFTVGDGVQPGGGTIP